MILSGHGSIGDGVGHGLRPAMRHGGRTADGQTFTNEKRDWHGYAGRPMTFNEVAAKFDRIAASNANAAERRIIVDAVRRLDTIATTDLMSALALKA